MICARGSDALCVFIKTVHLAYIQGKDHGPHRECVIQMSSMKLWPTYLELYIDPHCKGSDLCLESPHHCLLFVLY